MSEPSQRSTRIALAACAAVALLASLGGYMIGRASAPAAPRAATPASDPPPSLPDVVRPLSRADLLELAASAADAYAAGEPGPAGNSELIGRRFQLKIPFGCYGASPEDGGAQLRWNYDGETQSLRLSAAPEVWTSLAWMREAAGSEVEAIEGFWLPRPWSRDEACPTREARMVVPPILPLPQQTVALAQFFTKQSSRVPRREGKPYETVKKVVPEQLQADEGFRLVVAGRIAALANGQPAACQAPSAELQPVCAIAVEFDRIAIVNPLSGEQLAEWLL